MAIVIQGLDRVIWMLDEFEIDLSRDMNRKIAKAMEPIARKARGFVPAAPPASLKNWLRENTVEYQPYRAFPVYDSAEIKSGIYYKPGLQKENRKGFAKAFVIVNESAAGAIYETAGRRHPNGNPAKSRSANPKAGKWFIEALPPVSKRSQAPGKRGRRGKSGDGRLIFRAWNEDQGKVLGAFNAAVNYAKGEFNKRHQWRQL